MLFMRNFLLLVFLLILIFPASAQKNLSNLPKVYTYVEKPASYPSDRRAAPSYMAREALFTYIAQNFADKEALATVTEYSTALYTLTINPAGTLEEITVKKGISPAIDQEFIRVLKSIPAWVPAEHDGRAVHSIMNIPLVIHPYHPDYTKRQIQEYKYFFTMEEMPTFKGGSEALIKALQHNFKNIPQPLIKDPGKPLILQLVINSDGKPLQGETKVFNGHNLATNELLALAAENLPAFNPAKHNGLNPIARYSLPIGFNEKGEIVWVHSPPKEQH